MLYPVRILDARGNLRKLVSSKEVSQLHWEKFERMMAGEFSIGNRKHSGQGAQKIDDLEYDEETLESET